MASAMKHLSGVGAQRSPNQIARDRALISAQIAVTSRFMRQHDACRATTQQDLRDFWHLVDNVLESGSPQAVTAAASWLLPRVGTSDHVTAVANYFMARCASGAAGLQVATGTEPASGESHLFRKRLGLCYVFNSLLQECKAKADHPNAASVLLAGLRPILPSFIMLITGSAVSAVPKVHFAKVKGLLVNWKRSGFFDDSYMNLLATAARGRLAKPRQHSATVFGDPAARWHDQPTTIFATMSKRNGEHAVQKSSMRSTQLEANSYELEVHGSLLVFTNDSSQESEPTIADGKAVAPGPRVTMLPSGEAGNGHAWSQAFAKEENSKKRKRSDSSVGHELERTRVDRSSTSAAARAQHAPRGPANNHYQHQYNERSSRGRGGPPNGGYQGHDQFSRGGGEPPHYQRGGYGRGRGNANSQGRYNGGRWNDSGRRGY